MSTTALGTAAEAAVLQALAAASIPVLVPFGGGLPFGRGQRHYCGRADVIAVHVRTLGEIFVVPVDDCPSYRGFLRLEAPRNGQRRVIRLAERYSFDSWAESLAAARPC